MSENSSANIIFSSSGPSHANLNGGLDLSNHKPPTDIGEKSSETIQENSKPNKKGAVSNANTSPSKPKKRKKCLRDAKAPKQPLTGYFRFLNDRREKVRSENPSMAFAEITKTLANEWNVLPAEQKQLYLDAAEQDKERYVKEFNDYKQTDAYKAFLEKQKERENKKSTAKQKESKKEKNGTDTPNSTILQKETHKDKKEEEGTYEIPIFTEEFLDHNKACEAELRQLRKSTTDYESQNAVLQRHVESLHTAVNRLEADTSQQIEVNEVLQQHLNTLRSQLASCLSNIPIAGEGATLQNIDIYIERLENLLSSNMESSLRNSVRTAVSRLDFIK